ncbi:MAG: hypothetical protein M3Z35_16375 [Nitrospirota bacterium]|nr:hypothetical protein [Nitrospirota bacterium]
MKSQVWFPALLALMVVLAAGCSGGDSPSPVPSVPSVGGGGKALDTMTPPSNALTGDETGLMSEGEAQPGPAPARPPG